MKRAPISEELGVQQLFEQQFSLPNGMPIVFNVIDQQSRHGELPKSLDIPTHGSIHHQILRNSGIFEDSLEYRSASLRVAHHGEVLFVSQGFQYLSVHSEREGLDCFLAASRSTVSGAVYGNNVELTEI